MHLSADLKKNPWNNSGRRKIKSMY